MSVRELFFLTLGSVLLTALMVFGAGFCLLAEFLDRRTEGVAVSIPVGEHPEMPPEAQDQLRGRIRSARESLQDAFWDSLARNAVIVFEAHRGKKS